MGAPGSSANRMSTYQPIQAPQGSGYTPNNTLANQLGALRYRTGAGNPYQSLGFGTPIRNAFSGINTSIQSRIAAIKAEEDAKKAAESQQTSTYDTNNGG